MKHQFRTICVHFQSKIIEKHNSKRIEKCIPAKNVIEINVKDSGSHL